MKVSAIFSLRNRGHWSRVALALGYFVLLGTLVIRSHLHRTGDAGDYMAMTLNLSRFHTPAMSSNQIAWTEKRFQKIGLGYQEISLVWPAILTGDDGKSDFMHFWFFPALAVPPMWATDLLGLSPALAFVILNFVLLLTAFWIVSGKLNPVFTIFLFCSPILWWVNKAQVEVFTFALIAIAFALLSERPWWSMVILGAAATQNPPISFAVGFIALSELLQRPKAALKDRRLWIGGTAGSALALTSLVYYRLRLGTAMPIFKTGGAQTHWPSLGEARACIVDPNIGLLTNFPLFIPILVAVAIALLVKHRARLRAPAIWVATATVFALLYSFCQTRNLNNGGTPSMSRYDLWLIPLAIPLLREADRAFGRAARLGMVPVVVVSCAVSLIWFQPPLPESYLRPTRVADFLWTQHPWVDNPLPEIFVERLRHEDSGFWMAYIHHGCKAALAYVPTATPSCSKMLLVGQEPVPAPCRLPTEPPPRCERLGAFCYANRTRKGYRFTPPPMDQIQRYVDEVVSSPTGRAQCGS